MTLSTDRDGAGTAEVGTAPDDVARAVRLCLQTSPYQEIRRITCQYEDGVLILGGRVPTFHCLQLVQTAVAEIPGVTRLIIEIEVESPGGRSIARRADLD